MITMLLSQSIDSPSGLGRYFPWAKELTRAGLPVQIIALHPNYHEQQPRSFVRDGVRVQYVAQMHVLKKENHKHHYSNAQLLRISLEATWALLQHTIRRPGDVIHIGKPHPFNGFAGLLGGLLKQRRVYLDCDDYEAGSSRYTSKWQRPVVQASENLLPRLASRVTTNTHFTEQRLIKHGIAAEKLVYLPNGIDRERFAALDPNRVRDLRQQLHLDGHPVIGYVGTIGFTSHPLHLLMDAMTVIKTQSPQTRLVIVGGGEDFETLRRQIHAKQLESNVHLTGRVSALDALHYMALADVTVDPVLADSAAAGRMPLKLVESMALGIPAVTGDIGDRREILAQGCAGKLVRAGDAGALAEGLLEVLEDTQLRTSLRNAALAQAERYWWDVLIRRVLSIY